MPRHPANLAVYRLFARAPWLGYRAKILTLLTLAALLPLVELMSLSTQAHGPLPLALAAPALLVLAVALAIVHQLLAPIELAAEQLTRFNDGGPAPEFPAIGGEDAAGRLLNGLQDAGRRLQSLDHRLDQRHPVTGLATREPFLAAIAADIEMGALAGMVGVVRFADYDRLAAFDQEAADAALTLFARRFEDAMGASRPIAQIDRDTFGAWYHSDHETGQAADELKAVGYVLGQDLLVGGRPVKPEIRLAGALYPRDGDAAQVLLTRAGAALAAGPHHGDGPAFYSPQSSSAAQERFTLEQDLRRAIDRDQFLLHFQPVVDLADGRVVGAEALLRWRHPELGFVPPAAFIPRAEEAGLMNEIGLWVLNAACREAGVWREQGLTDLKMAVNLSARQLQDPELSSIILRTLERHGLSAQNLELELTETAAMEDSARTRELFHQLRSLGVGVAIDDFGSGYSSLSYVKNLPFSKLKIDREFVMAVDERRDSRAICAALVELARGLDITVLAEGVESGGEVDTLRELGCSMFQGFFFARPIIASSFIDTVTDPRWLARLGEGDGLQRRRLPA